MQFEEILARCLEALERGETIDQCLARYPEHGSELEPLLRLAVAVRSAPRPRLSTDAYTKGRAALKAQASYQQSLQAPFQHRPQNQPPPSTKRPVRRVRQSAVAGTRLPRVQPPGLVLFLHRATGLFVSLMVLLCLVTLLRNIAISVPGSALYTTKRLGETVQGALLIAAGEPAAWYAHQTETRLRELLYLANQGQPINPELTAAIEAGVQAALAASAALPAAEHRQFLLAWTENLETLGASVAATSPATLTLRKTIATVQAASEVTVAPTAVPATSTSSPTVSATLTATPEPVNTAVPLSTTSLATATSLPAIDNAENGFILLPVTATDTPPSLSLPTEPIAFETSQVLGTIEVRMPEEATAEDKHEADDAQDNTTEEQPTPAAPPEATSSFGTAPVSDFSIATATDVVQQAETNHITKTVQQTATVEVLTPTAEETNTPILTAVTGTPDATEQPLETPILSLPTATEQDSPVTSTPTPQPTRTPTPMRTPTPGRTPTPANTPKETEATPTHAAPTDSPTAQRTPTKEPKKTVEPTEPIETPEATETPEVEDPEPTRAEPTLQPVASPMSTATPESTKSPGKK